MARLSRVLRGTDEEFFDLFERAGRNIAHAAQLLHEMLAEYPVHAIELTAQIKECEREGDTIVHAATRRLNRTFVTPIDREDILQLSSSLDDIVDYIEEVADYLGVYKIDAPMEQSERLALILLSATQQIALAIPLMRGFHDISAHTVETHRLENEGDEVVRAAVGALFEDGTDPMVVIRWKDIYERLESAIDATERTASILEGIFIKHS
jgi:predicted phosphate transport protein (TIGR00153 family)